MWAARQNLAALEEDVRWDVQFLWGAETGTMKMSEELEDGGAETGNMKMSNL